MRPFFRQPLIPSIALALSLSFSAPMAMAKDYVMRISIAGNALSAYVPPEIGAPVSVSSGTLDFGSLNVGQSAQGSVSVYNTSEHPTEIRSIAVTGATAVFSASHDCPSQLGAGGQCTVTVTASPTLAGTHSGQLLVRDAIVGHYVTLTIVAGTPTLEATGDGSFGVVQLGDSASATFQVSNSSSGSLVLDSMEITGDDAFSITGGTCGAGVSLGAGQSCQSQVGVAPAAGGNLAGFFEVSANGQSATIPLSVIVPDPATAAVDELAAGSTSLVANGVSTTTLAATVRDALGNALGAGHVVTWTTSLGTVDASSSTTGPDGVASATFLAPATVGTASVSAQLGSSAAKSVVINLTPDVGSAHVDALSAPLKAVAGKSFTVTATVRDALGNNVGAGQTVTWQTNAGTLASSSSTTDANGQAHVNLTAPTAVTPITVQARVQEAEAPTSASIAMTADFDSRRVVLVQTDSSTLEASGEVMAPLYVWSEDQYGNPVAEDVIDISSSHGALDLVEVVTDENGQSSGMYTVPRILWSKVDGLETITISATSRGTAITESTTLTVKQALDLGQFSFDKATRTVTQNTGVPLTFFGYKSTNIAGNGYPTAGTFEWQPGQGFVLHVQGNFVFCRMEANGLALRVADPYGVTGFSAGYPGDSC